MTEITTPTTDAMLNSLEQDIDVAMADLDLSAAEAIVTIVEDTYYPEADFGPESERGALVSALAERYDVTPDTGSSVLTALARDARTLRDDLDRDDLDAAATVARDADTAFFATDAVSDEEMARVIVAVTARLADD